MHNSFLAIIYNASENSCKSNCMQIREFLSHLVWYSGFFFSHLKTLFFFDKTVYVSRFCFCSRSFGVFTVFFLLLLFSIFFVFSIFFCRFSLFCTLICASSMQLDGLVYLKVMLQSFISVQLICFARRLTHVQYTCIFVRFVFCHHKYTHATSATATTKPKTATTLNKRRSTKINTKYWAMHILSTWLSDLKEEKKNGAIYQWKIDKRAATLNYLLAFR